MDYRTRPRQVQAERFFPGMEHFPFEEENVVQYGCECLEETGCCRFCNRYWIFTPVGKVVLRSGDFVVKVGDRQYVALPSESFNLTYEQMN